MKNLSHGQLALILFAFVVAVLIIADKYDVFEGAFSLNPLGFKFKAKRESNWTDIADANPKLTLQGN
jgi:hypothetical protein